MGADTKRILEKIKSLEAERNRLLPLRKEEIFNILKNHGGLTLDNNLLAGFVIYAAKPENATSSFLQELSELGRNNIPSKKARSK